MKPAYRQRTWAFTLIELLVTIAVFALIIVIILPGIHEPNRSTRSRWHCTNNLRQIGVAFRAWALDNNDRFPMQVTLTNSSTFELLYGNEAYVHFQAMSNELSTPKFLICPSDREKTWATNFTTDFSNQKVSYFVGLDASAETPNSFLSGDRNLTNALGIKGGILTLITNLPVSWTEGVHVKLGNICLADGSVLQLTSHGLQNVHVNSGLATNRLAMP